MNCVSVVPLLCHFIAECGHDEGGIIVGREVSLMESFSVLNVILLADPFTVLKAMEKGGSFSFGQITFCERIYRITKITIENVRRLCDSRKYLYLPYGFFGLYLPLN